MARKNRRTHHENNDLNDMMDPALNPFLMINPSITGTPLGMLPILPIPSLNPDDYKEEGTDKRKE